MSSTSRAILGWISAIAAFFVFLTYILAMGMATALVTVTRLASDLMGYSGRPVLGAFYLYSKFTVLPITVNLLVLTYTFIVIYVVCFFVAFRSRDGFFPSLRQLTRVGRITSSTNWLVAMPLVSSGLIITVLIVTFVLSQAGVPSGSLCDPNINKCPTQAQLFAGLAYAPIGEELAFRVVTPLGLVVPFRILWRRISSGQGPSKKKFLMTAGVSILSPERAKRTTGFPTFANSGWRGVHWLEWIFIVFSSILFGIAHVDSGGGTNWGAGKVVTAAISGFVIAIVYVGYGAYAAILLHWFFDFYFEAAIVGGPIIGGLFSVLPFLFSLTALVVGALSVLVALAWVFKRARMKIKPTESPTTYKSPDPEPLPVQA